MDQTRPTEGLSEEHRNEERLRRVIEMLYKAAGEVETLLAETKGRIEGTGENDG